MRFDIKNFKKEQYKPLKAKNPFPYKTKLSSLSKPIKIQINLFDLKLLPFHFHRSFFLKA